MSLLQDRHLNKDFFVLDIADAAPKDDMASMEHPLFSLATKPDMRHLSYRHGQNRLDIIPSGIGLPTIFDKDILIFCISQLMQKKNCGEKIGKRLAFSAHALLKATNRPTNNLAYERLEAAFTRLRGTTFKTNIESGGRVKTRVFGMIDEGGFVRHENSFRLDFCEIVLSDWLMRAIETDQVVTISPKYFRLRRPLERRLYEIARKHCGNQKRWQIGLEKLQTKTGSNAPLKKFRLNLRQIIKHDHTPFYRFEIAANDIVTVQPRSTTSSISASDISIPDWAVEKGTEIAIAKGWDFYALRKKWMDFARAETARGNPPKDAGTSFIGYCNKAKNLRNAY